MTVRDSEPKPSEEERLMALLALTSQKLPDRSATNAADAAAFDTKSMAPADIESLHAYLDAHPEAFERLLRRQHTSPTVRTTTTRTLRDWIGSRRMPRTRFALAFGVAAACAMLVFFMTLRVSPGTHVMDLDRGYADLADSVGQDMLASLATREVRTEGELGFSARSTNDTTAAASFAAGLEYGRRKLQSDEEALSEPEAANETLYLLGQWNMLLWGACEVREPLAPVFWLTQHERYRSFADDVRQGRVADPVVVVHVQRVESLLARLAERHSPRAAYELSQELLLFRTRFSAYAARP